MSDSFQSAEKYVNGTYLQKLKQAPRLSDFSIDRFETITEASVKAGASIGVSAA